MLRLWTTLAFFFVLPGLMNLTPASLSTWPSTRTSMQAHHQHARAYSDQNQNADDDDDDYSDGELFNVTAVPVLPQPPKFEARLGVTPYLPLLTQTHQEPEIQPPKI